MNDELAQKMLTILAGIQEENNRRFSEMDKKFEELHAKLDGIYNILDRQTDMLDIDETERLALSKQVDRHDDWIERAAPKVGVTYTVKS